jgi:hypothetical protein
MRGRAVIGQLSEDEMIRQLVLLIWAMSATVAYAQPAISNEPIVLTHPRPWQHGWVSVSNERRIEIPDDDTKRHADDPAYWDGIAIEEKKFSENGFDWHLLRFTNLANPNSVIWVVPHDDENAAFEGAIAALKKHGGMAVVVNSGPGSLRRQKGRGQCSGRPAIVNSCDPNRNFSVASPLFTNAFLDHRTEDSQPIIALHTNGAGAAGDFSLLDLDAFKRGKTQLREGAFRARNPSAQMDNYDTLGLIAYASKDGGPSAQSVACRNALNDAGIHFWHERVNKSDGSLSNYLALERPEIPYFNAESREEIDLAVSAARHGVMIDAYLQRCRSGDKPAP